MRRVLLLLALVALGGCGDEGSGPGAAATTAPPAKGDVVVKMETLRYVPDAVTVKVGQRITWVNEDGAQHDVESTSGERIDSELFGEGKSFSYAPRQAGTIEYVCTVHPGMDGRITVIG